jgi:hypothetical protein
LEKAIFPVISRNITKYISKVTKTKSNYKKGALQATKEEHAGTEL